MKRLALAFVAACAPRPAPVSVSLPLPVVAETASAMTPAPPPKLALDAADFTSERGGVHLSVEPGGALAGWYESQGVLTCATAGTNAYSCHWYNGNNVGRATFRRAASGRLEGTWGSGESDTDGGAWTLVPVPRAGDGLSGAWISNWGAASIRDDGRAMHIDYPTGTLDCTHAGADKLACTWAESGSTGGADLVIESPRLLRGTWGSGPSATDGGQWVFVRR